MQFIKKSIFALFVLLILFQFVTAVSSEDAKLITKIVNELRAKHHSPALEWDKTLEKYAQDWTNKCVFQHSGGPYGENLAYGTTSWNHTIYSWYDEVSKYNYNRPGFSGVTGHFTALVWKSTTKIGCGVKTCNGLYPGAKIYTCSFSPAGNIVGYNNKFFAQNVLKP